MTPADFRRIALSLEGAEEGSHMGSADFRVAGRIFATLAAQKQGYGNLMLTPEMQAQFVAEAPEVFVPIAGGWGKNGATHVRLAKANEDLLTGALRAAWKIRAQKNAATRRSKRALVVLIAAGLSLAARPATACQYVSVDADACPQAPETGDCPTWCKIERIEGPYMTGKLCLGVAVFAISLLAQGSETHKARLTAVPADARTRPSLAGIGSATGMLSGTKLTITGMFEGLLSPATVAQLHSAVAAGVRGPVIGDLTVAKATSGSISGSFDLNPQQVENFHKGGLYIQIHSEKAPDGVIWGWLTK